MKQHILLIDDDEDEVTFFLAALKQVDIPNKCTWAKNGEQAIKQLAFLTPDIIFLDIQMPGMNGLECLAALKRLPHLHTIPVILHSSTLTDYHRRQGISLGATACLTKPDTINAWAEVVETFIHHEALGTLR